jgi:hypothetical protein
LGMLCGSELADMGGARLPVLVLADSFSTLKRFHYT